MSLEDKIFVTGVIGSGKTTASRELANQYGITEIRQTDEIGECLSKEDSDYEEQYMKALKEMINLPGSAIVEGVGLMKMPVEFFADKALVVIRTPVDVATRRAIKRNNKGLEHARDTVRRNRDIWNPRLVNLLEALEQ